MINRISHCSLIIIVLVFSPGPSSSAQNGWEEQTSGVPPDKDLSAVRALNTLVAWTCGADGTVLRTTDGGITWISANAGSISSSEQLVSLEVFNADQAWVGSGSGAIYFTTDAGQSWTQQVDSGFGTVAMIKRTILSRLIAIADAASGADTLGVLATTDLGSSWTNVNTTLVGGSIPHGAADFRDASNGFLWSGIHGLQQTTDAGITWTGLSVAGLDTVCDIGFVDSQEGFIVGNGGTIWQSIDGGGSWSPLSLPPTSDLHSGGFALNSPYRFAVGAAGTIIASSDMGSSWSSQVSNVSTSLNAVSFGSATIGWIVGDDGTVLKTSSAGVLPEMSGWQIQSHAIPSDQVFKLVRAITSSECLILSGNSSGTVLVARTTDTGDSWGYVSSDLGIPESDIISYDIQSSDTLYLGTSDGKIYQTTDGGSSWDSLFSSEDVSNFQYLRFFNGEEGIAVGDAANSGVPIGIFGTTDGGMTWMNQNSSFLGSFTFPDAVAFYSRMIGFLVTLPQDEWHSTSDGGQSWTTYVDHPTVTYYHWLDSQTMLGVGIEGPSVIDGIYKTTDSGMSWIFKTDDGSQVTNDNFSSIGSTVWALSSTPDPFTGYQQMLHSTDTGETWSTQQLPITDGLTGVSFAATDSGWAVTDDMILFTGSGGITGVAGGISEGVPSGYCLRQNYPNPFNPTTTLRIEVPVSGHVRLSIFDVLGREITTLVNESRHPGVYNVRWDGVALPTGIYFARLEANRFVQIQKMVLLK